MRTKQLLCTFFLLFIMGQLFAQTAKVSVTSPFKKIVLNIQLNGSGQPYYTVDYAGQQVLKPSKLGVVREDADLSKGLKLLSVSKPEKVTDRYQMAYAKRKDCSYTANKRTFSYRNAAGIKMDIIFQVSDDGVAFRYSFPGKTTDVKRIITETSSFHFPATAKAFLQPMAEAKSGWEHTNPSYEEHYKQNIEVGTPAPSEAGWIYPALFQSGTTWLLITEAYLDSNYCGTRLKAASPGGEYSVGFPDPREVFTGRGLLPQSKLPFSSPWRIITIGSLKTIVESTLGTDLAKPAMDMDQSFIKPGKSSWSWINSKDDSIVYTEQKRYIDFAAEMHWQYCLIDADWDRKIGYDKIKELADYAAPKSVGVLLWYNSAGDWNTVKYTPKNRLLTHESRVKEFSRLKEMGIKGVKIDFFGGDGQSMIAYYHDILRDAADYQLLVNFHGATLPRGWARTYPNLMTMESIKGFEFITFEQKDADAQPNHCAMLPFTRNAFDPMDFTPMNLYKIPTRVIRKTSSGFELALPVLFLSGIQHFAESPQGMSHVPDYVKQFLRDLPVQWDDVQFIDGFPGKFAVLARKAGDKWYVAGINGEATEKSIAVDLSSFGKSKATLITDGTEALTFSTESWSLDQNKSKQVLLKPNGGFVMMLE